MPVSIEPVQIDLKISHVKFKLISAKSSGDDISVDKLTKELDDLKRRLERGETFDVPF